MLVYLLLGSLGKGPIQEQEQQESKRNQYRPIKDLRELLKELQCKHNCYWLLKILYEEELHKAKSSHFEEELNKKDDQVVMHAYVLNDDYNPFMKSFRQ